MGRRLFVLLAVTILAASVPSEAKMRTPSTPQERERALSYVQSLEQNPLAKDSLDKRLWLTEWIVGAPNITVKFCCKELDTLDAVNGTYSNQLRMQAIYSQAAYVLRHPGVQVDDAAREAAGLQGTLRAYRAIQRFDPKVSYPVLDNLAALDKQGKLRWYVQQQGTTGASGNTDCADN